MGLILTLDCGIWLRLTWNSGEMLYHGPVARLVDLSLALLLAACLAPPLARAGGEPGPPRDRLDRFRELAHTRLAEANVLGPDDAAAAYADVARLLDEEILDSLDAGGIFADPVALDDRLRALTEVWGGAAVRVNRLGDATVAVVRLTETGAGNSVRIYRRADGRAALVTALSRHGTPAVHAMPVARAGRHQVLVVWEGERSARGTTPLALELIRLDPDSSQSVWSTDARYGGDLQTWHHTVTIPEVVLRYELRYPGWVPGCEGQTDAEDVLRYAPGREGFVVARRRVLRAWHQRLHRGVAQLLAAIRARDATALRTLVPDRPLRQRLPAALEREPVCDAVEGTPPRAVNVAARAADGRAWALWFRRAAAAWRLSAVEPVLE